MAQVLACACAEDFIIYWPNVWRFDFLLPYVLFHRAVILIHIVSRR